MEQVKKIRAFFGRVGGKHFSKKLILPFIKELEYDIYVEPFIGAGSIFLGREKKANREIINDYDQLVVNLWKGMKASGNQLNEYSLYFEDKSIFKWWLLKEKQERRMRQNKGIYKGNKKYLKEIYGNNNNIETFKEDIFIHKKSNLGRRSPWKKIVAKNECFCINNPNNEIKIETINNNEEKENTELCCSIEKTEEGIKLIKRKNYVRNNKYKGDETKWKLHNPNFCGWTTLLKQGHLYHERLKDTEIYQGDYREMLKYDSPKTLFYFDPPWTKGDCGKNKGNNCYSGFVELKDFFNSIKELKGKWFCSYNNDKDILKQFEGHRIEYINTVYTQKKKGTRKTIDILIFSKNFFN